MSVIFLNLSSSVNITTLYYDIVCNENIEEAEVYVGDVIDNFSLLSNENYLDYIVKTHLLTPAIYSVISYNVINVESPTAPSVHWRYDSNSGKFEILNKKTNTWIERSRNTY